MAENRSGSLLKPLQILVCGKTGVGKSTLINSFFGCKVVEVNDPGSEDGDLSAGTTKVKSYRLRLRAIPMDIFDSPGLQSDKETGEYLQEIYEKCKDVDVFLYCLDMTSARFTKDDIATLQEFNKRFGENIWKRCVVVMTKANAVKILGRSKGKEREYHKNLYQTILSKFREELGKLGVSDSVRNAIPACAAGLAYCDVEEGTAATDEEMDEERFIWYPSDKAEPSDRPVDFLVELWLTCIKRIPTGPSRGKLLNCNETIYRKKPIQESKEVLRAKEEYERREWERQQEKREWKRQWEERKWERADWEQERRAREWERRDWEQERSEREWKRRDWEQERRAMEWEKEQEKKLARKDIDYKEHDMKFDASQFEMMNKAKEEQFDYVKGFFKFALGGVSLGATIGSPLGPVGAVVGGAIGGAAAGIMGLLVKELVQ